MRKDRRYTVTKEGTGASRPQWVARFCGEWLGCSYERAGVARIIARHQSRQPIDRFAFALFRTAGRFVPFSYRVEIYFAGEIWRPETLLDELASYRDGFNFHGFDWRAVRRDALAFAERKTAELEQLAALRAQCLARVRP